MPLEATRTIGIGAPAEGLAKLEQLVELVERERWPVAIVERTGELEDAATPWSTTSCPTSRASIAAGLERR